MITLHYDEPFTLGYSFAGRFVTDDEWIHPIRTIDTYEALMVTQGEVHLQENGTPYCLHAGDLILLRPGVQHGGTQPSAGRTSFFWAHFATDSFEKTYLQPGVHTPAEPDRLTSAFRCLLHMGNTPGYPLYAADAAMAVLIAEICASQALTGSGGSRLAQEIAEWIRINSEKKLTVQSVADQFKYHPDYLCTLMKRSFGRGLKEYINDRRMDTIRAKLLSDGLTLKEIARQTGFDDYKDFLKYFRYHEGITPTEFRNLYYKTHLNNK